jgi:hypothetical protein
MMKACNIIVEKIFQENIETHGIQLIQEFLIKLRVFLNKNKQVPIEVKVVKFFKEALRRIHLIKKINKAME